MDSALSKRKSRLSSSGKIVDYNDWEIVAKIFQLLDKSMGSPEKKKISYFTGATRFPYYIQLFRERLSKRSIKAYATMPKGIMVNCQFESTKT